ncbi:MAG TPA: hypothetical protein PLV92_25290, partial [Pirellulaceae bacterium]|nr:hypothetical protein [Pirellulaceae bacterium]
MLANKPWTQANLRTIGGAAGVGRAFLEETFDSRSSNAIARIHRDAAAKLLDALLPESGSLIKGRQRTRDELIEVTGYKSRPNDFDELINFLDRELRIITPVSTDDVPCYQLTHDYLVPSLRDWLTAKQRESWRGRAMLLLAERTAEWTAKPRVRSLPGPLECVRILATVCLPTRRLGRAPQKLSPSQQRLMRRATSYYGTLSAVLAIVVALAAWGGREWNGRTQARALVDSLMVAGPDEIRSQVAKLAPYRRWADRLLEQRLAETEERDGERRLRLRLALVPVREHQVAPLVEQMLQTNEPRVFGAIRESLAESRALHAPQWADAYWQRLHDAQAESTSRFFAGVALARFVPPDDAAWTDDDWRLVVTELLRANPEHQGRWRELLRPLRERLFPAAEAAFTDSTKPESEQLAAANLVADYWKDDAARLAR